MIDATQPVLKLPGLGQEARRKLLGALRMLMLTALMALPAAATQRQQSPLLVPRLETQGRVCHGHFHATTRVVSFRSQTMNCLNRRYTSYREETIARPDIPLFGTRSQIFRLPPATAQCRITVIEVVEPADPDAGYRYLFFYANDQAFHGNRFDDDPAQNNVLSCMGYETEWPRKPQPPRRGATRASPAAQAASR